MSFKSAVPVLGLTLLFVPGCSNPRTPNATPSPDVSAIPVVAPTLGVAAMGQAGGPRTMAERIPSLISKYSVRVRDRWTMRETVVDALGRIGEPAVPELRRALVDSNPAIRAQAADVLARIGPQSVDALPELTIMLDDEEEYVRKTAARAIGQIGPAAFQAVPQLMRVLNEETVKEQTQEHFNESP